MHAAPLIAWKQAPFLRLIFPFATGIVFQYYTNCPPFIPIIAATISTLIILLLSKASIPILFKFKNFLAYTFLILLFAAGALTMHHKSQSLQASDIHHIEDSVNTYIATIQEPLSEKTNSYKTVATLTHQLINDSAIPVKASLLLYFSKHTSNARLYYGHKIVFRKQLQTVKGPANPGSFNYKTYCQHQGIFHQAYLTPADYTVLQQPLSSSFRYTMFKLRDTIVNILARFIHGPKEAGLAEALLIGYKEDLDKSLIQSYSNTGVIHVIAISGLHLGLIYMLLTLLFKPLGNKKFIRIIRPIFIITGLWIFGFLAGGSPSILRSALMFTCIAIGECFSKKASIYNSLAASAFILLCYNPHWLWDAGFQLSYTAVASIALFQQLVYNTFTFTNRLADTCWKLISTTIAAQILTLPLTLYLFHQFPVLFLITNLIAIPLSSIILIGEILLCLLSFIPIAANPTGALLSWLIKCMNASIEYFDKLPFASITPINISLTQMALLYAAIATLSIWLMHKQKQMVIPALLFLLVYFSIGAIDAWQLRHQNLLLAYHLPKATIIDHISGRQFTPSGDSSAEQQFNTQLYILKPARNALEVKRSDTPHQNGPLLFTNTRTLLLIGPDFPEPPPLNHPLAPVDALLISHDPPLSPRLLLSRIPCKTLVLDGSNSPKTIRKYTEVCQEAGIPCHSTANHGAFVLNGW
ncbi:MAG: ComEC/Rec2 family competence protein [Pseudobacter sp.]|uniref:ComEC/Rec2 family competence protein n=1 Tax=Pseudobacter sp. TaxID=2045420 RepID=UPI003F7CFEFA